MVSFPGQARGDHDELLLEMILDRRPLPPGAAAGMVALADGLAGLAAAPGAGVLPGESAAVAAFLRSGSPAGGTLPLAGGRPARRRRLAGGRARLAAAAAVVTVMVSGTAAAYAGALPASVQDFAHRVIGAPAPGPAHGHAAGHQPGARQHPAGQPGAAPSAAPSGRGHRASPGKHNGQHRHHRRHPGHRKHKPAHPAPRPHPSHTPGPANQ